MPLLEARGHPRPSLTTGFFNFLVKQQIPVVASQTLLIAEIIRKIPVDIRMGNRAYRRGHLNISELLYFSIKLFAAVAVVLDCILQESTAPGSPANCRNISSLSIFLWYSSSTLVAAALAWRTYIIFARSKEAFRFLMLGLLIQTSTMLVAVVKMKKFLAIDDGYCNYSAEQFAGGSKPWYRLASPWFVFINFCFDFAVVTASTWKLVSSSRGPLGFSGLARTLISNGVQYALLVCTNNLLEFILVASMGHKIPSLLNLSITIQVITGLNLIAEEQDAVHGYTRSALFTSNGPNPRGYSTQQNNGSRPTGKAMLATRDTGVSSGGYGYGVNTSQGVGEYSKETYHSTMSAEDPGVIEMHTCVDVEVNSGGSDIDEKSPKLAGAAISGQRNGQGPNVPWEITMASPTRRKAPSISSSGMLNQTSNVRNSIVAFAPTSEHPRSNPADDGTSIMSKQGPGEAAPILRPSRSFTASTPQPNQNSGINPSSKTGPTPPRTPNSATSGGGTGGVSIRAIRQAMQNNATMEVQSEIMPGTYPRSKSALGP